MKAKVGLDSFRILDCVLEFPGCGADSSSERMVEEFGLMVTCRSEAIFAEIHSGGNRFDCGLEEFDGLAVFVCFENLGEDRVDDCFLEYFGCCSVFVVFVLDGCTEDFVDRPVFCGFICMFAFSISPCFCGRLGDGF